jgi:hypothetical protein
MPEAGKKSSPCKNKSPLRVPVASRARATSGSDECEIAPSSDPTSAAVYSFDIVRKTQNAEGPRFARNVTPAREWIDESYLKDLRAMLGAVPFGCDFTADCVVASELAAA